MVAADLDEGAGEGWGEDAALVIDEGTYLSFWNLLCCIDMYTAFCSMLSLLFYFL